MQTPGMTEEGWERQKKMEGKGEQNRLREDEELDMETKMQGAGRHVEGP